MKVLAEQVEAVPVRNLRVPRAEFAAVWIGAEQRADADPTDWFAVGVVSAARWLARATYPVAGGSRFAAAPVSGSTVPSHEELIEDELVAAERLLSIRPTPDALVDRPGWIEGVIAMLRWSWLRAGGAPLAVRKPA